MQLPSRSLSLLIPTQLKSIDEEDQAEKLPLGVQVWIILAAALALWAILIWTAAMLFF